MDQKNAAREAGGRLVAIDQATDLVWGGTGPRGLRDLLKAGGGITWVQLPSAGVEAYADLIDDQRAWTSAKGIYGVSVAEHALALALAGVHHLPQLARAHSWQAAPCENLYDGTMTVIGGGGIARALLDLLVPFNIATTVVRRHIQEMPGAARVLPPGRLHDALMDANVVVLAAALTPETEGMIGAAELRVMRADAWLVNVGRGKLVRTGDLVTALAEGWIGGAALDVTDPEPLPADHALWHLDNCLITPHCANPPALEHEHYAALVRDNIRRRIEGKPLDGAIDTAAGY